jgi:hypothetical protein
MLVPLSAMILASQLVVAAMDDVPELIIERGCKE